MHHHPKPAPHPETVTLTYDDANQLFTLCGDLLRANPDVDATRPQLDALGALRARLGGGH